MFLSVVVHDLDARGTALPVRPLETDPPLYVDADAVPAFAVAFQAFKRVRGQRPQVGKAGRRVQNVETLFRPYSMA